MVSIKLDSVKPKPSIKYKCDICDKEYAYPGGLRRHKESIHLFPDRYECKYCSRKFGRADYKSNHEVTCEKKFRAALLDSL